MKWNLATAEGQQARLDAVNGKSKKAEGLLLPFEANGDDFILALMHHEPAGLGPRAKMALAFAKLPLRRQHEALGACPSIRVHRFRREFDSVKAAIRSRTFHCGYRSEHR